MRILIQRVQQAAVTIEGSIYSQIGKGLLVLVGITHDDQQEDADWLAQKLINLRIFADEAGVMNLSVLEARGEILVVSQFTLHAQYKKKGNRPSYIAAARPEQAIPLYTYFAGQVSALLNKEIATGQFGADMQVSL